MSNINFVLTEQDARILFSVLQRDSLSYEDAGFISSKTISISRLKSALSDLLQAHAKDGNHEQAA